MLAAARVIGFLIGGALLLVGLVLLVTPARFAGFAWALTGAAILVALVLERSRYRSIDADVRNDAPGPGGGEPPGVLPPGFRPTDEVFIDPSSGRRMRVYLQPATGSRRYMAED